MSHTGNDSDNLNRDVTKQWPRLGIMVFSSVRKVLHANQAAYHFLKVLNCTDNGHTADGALPGSIADLFDQILQSLESRITHHDSDPLEARQSLVWQNRSVLVPAFGLPNRLGTQRSRVVVTMQEVTRPFDVGSIEAIPLCFPNRGPSEDVGQE